MVSSNQASQWVIWYDEYPSDTMEAEDFFERCIRFKEIQTADEFRSAWRDLADGERSIPDNSNLRVFRRNIRPIVADTRNSRGGRFSLTFENDKYLDVWHTLVSAIASEELMPTNFLNGVVLTVKPERATIQVWVTDATAYDDIEYMKCQLLLLLNVRKLTFIRHASVRLDNPFEQTNPSWAKRVHEFQSCSSRASSSASRARPRSCRNKLTPLEDPFLRPNSTAEVVHANSESDSSTGSDDNVDHCLKKIGVAPVMNRHGRNRRNRPRKDKLLGADEYEKALNMLVQPNRRTMASLQSNGFWHGFIAVWTHFWLMVSHLKTDNPEANPAAPTKQASMESLEQRLSVMCYAVVFSIYTVIENIVRGRGCAATRSPPVPQTRSKVS